MLMSAETLSLSQTLNKNPYRSSSAFDFMSDVHASSEVEWVAYRRVVHELELVPLGERYSKNTLGISLPNSPEGCKCFLMLFLWRATECVSAWARLQLKCVRERGVRLHE